MNDEESQGDDRRDDSGDGPPADADSWVAQWVDLFERPDPGGTGSSGGRRGSARSKRSAEVGDPIVSGTDDGDEPWVTSIRRPSLGRRLSATDRHSSGRQSSDAEDVAAIAAWQRAQERSRRKAQVLANQRAARQMQRDLPNQANPAEPVAGLAMDDGSDQHGSVQRLGLVAGGLLIIIVGLIGYLFIGLGGAAEQVASPDLTVPERGSELDLDLAVGADVAPATIAELTASTVQLVGLDDNGVAQCAGSGIIVASDGTILTNAHVVTSEGSCRFTTIGVALTVDSSTPPELLYRARVDELGPGLDLAILRIEGPLTEDSGAPWPRTFVPAPLGDSDTVQLGDPLRILGYPVIGGDTITLTSGTVSGFTSQVGLGNRALIKTDAAISAGNSGGLAVDADGRVIGIPTKARASERGPAVDCRPVSDTNADGRIGADDACVTVGGFLNGIRPINLAIPLLAAANVSDAPREPRAPAPVDRAQVMLFNPRFSTGIDGNGAPIDDISTAAAGIPELCLVVDWQGIPLGASWDVAWFVDGEVVQSSIRFDEPWTGPVNGQNFSLCERAPDDAGLPAGVHEISFSMGGQPVFVEAMELTERSVDQFAITWVNKTNVDLCQLAINPRTESGQLGLNELPVGLVIPPGGRWTTTMPRGKVIVEAYDCSGEAVANDFEGLSVDRVVDFDIKTES